MAANEIGHIPGRAYTGTDGVFNANGSDVQVCSADGAITITHGTVFITKAGVAVLTLAAPTVTDNDGDTLCIVSETANAHTVTNTSPGFNNLGAAGDVATFGAAVGNNIELKARNGIWYKFGTPVGVTLG